MNNETRGERSARPKIGSPLRENRGFRRIATGLAVGFAATVALLFFGDLAYITEFIFRAPAERISAFLQEVFSPETRFELQLSVTTATLTTVLALLIAVPAGYALSRFRIRGKVVVDTLVDAAIVLPPLIMGVSLLVVFSLIRRVSEATGTGGQPNPVLQSFYEFFVYERPGIVLAQFFVATALCIRALRAAFDAADRQAEGVALTLGCTRFGSFWRVALPQAVGGMLAGGLMAWSYSIGLFAPVAIFAGTVRGRTAVLPTRTFLEVSVGHLEIALALTLVMVGIAMSLLMAVKLLMRTEDRGAS